MRVVERGVFACWGVGEVPIGWRGFGQTRISKTDITHYHEAFVARLFLMQMICILALLRPSLPQTKPKFIFLCQTPPQNRPRVFVFPEIFPVNWRFSPGFPSCELKNMICTPPSCHFCHSLSRPHCWLTLSLHFPVPLSSASSQIPFIPQGPLVVEKLYRFSFSFISFVIEDKTYTIMRTRFKGSEDSRTRPPFSPPPTTLVFPCSE